MKNNTKIKVEAHATYVPDQSSPQERRFLWSYEISIENNDTEIVQLLSRYWRITDMTGHVEEVRGPGVVGLQPIIKPGKKFGYTSFCQITMPQGTMEGHYEMQTLNDERFMVEIPKLILTSPVTLSAEYRARLH